ncbi:MAG: helix-hairpin-helix domain-containing protein, partial [Candidatus Lokiarchaeota archaeon]
MAKAAEIKSDDDFKMGDPYFCPECGRNHVKGQIYKDHLKYAQAILTEEELEEEATEDSESSKDIDEEEIEENEEELEEDYNELPESELDEDDGEDGEDDEDDIVDLDFDDDDGKTAEECIEEVKDLPGVGEATLRKLIKAGFNSLESIAFTPPSIIQEDSGLGEKTTAKLIKTSMKRLGIGFKSAQDLWEVRKNISRITTGSPELDDLLGGGVETASM